jgi:quercetin dioxygenase-like cupin family protein
MKITKIEELPGHVAPKHYDLIGRNLFDAKGVKIGFTRMEKTGRCDPHVHDHAEQLFIVLKGEMMFRSAEGETPVKQGHTVLFQAGEVHSNYNVADGESEYMTVTTTVG